jgi:hypothetical protein
MKKNIQFSVALLGVLVASVPFITFAAGKTLCDIVAIVIGYLTVAIYLIIALAVVTFIWNVYRYFFTEKDKKEAGMYVLYSTIGFFVILSFWGLVFILMNSLKLPTGSPSFPSFGSFGNSSQVQGQNNSLGGVNNSSSNSLGGVTNSQPPCTTGAEPSCF